jgi:hypothetical protein
MRLQCLSVWDIMTQKIYVHSGLLLQNSKKFTYKNFTISIFYDMLSVELIYQLIMGTQEGTHLVDGIKRLIRVTFPFLFVFCVAPSAQRYLVLYLVQL